MVNFLAELRRRSIFRVGAAYAVVAWVLLQLVANISPILDLPPWVARTVVLLLIIGFPVALIFAWVNELTPEASATARVSAGKLDWALMAALVIVSALILYQQLAPSRTLTTAEAAQKGIAAARLASATEVGAISLAVLPFANLSGDAQQEFFSDGMTEEITSVLAKIPDLRVVGRTSAFQFKGQNQDLRAIGQALAATHLLEGSVRKEGNRLRITAQLIQAENGVHVWTESYNRELTGVFAIQEDIAAAIAGALKKPLGLAPGQTLVSLRPKDEETYELFLRGRSAWRARRTEEAVRFLEQAVARDPNFAPSWRFLSQARGLDNLGRRQRGEEPKTYPESGEALARRVIALAPGSPDGYALLANLALGEGKFLEALDLRKQALARDPDDPEVLNGHANDLWDFGYLKEAVAVRERQHVLEPLIPVYNSLRVQTMAANGMVDQAVRDWLVVRPNVTANNRFLMIAYTQLGRFDDAVDVLSQGGGFGGPGGGQPLPQAQIDAAVQVLRAAANKTAPPAMLPDFDGELAFLYAYTSTPERLLDYIENETKAGTPFVLREIWWPVPSSLRKTERFKALVRNVGFVDVWRVRGWPDLCRPRGVDDFACE
jgi:adenylate cyclase